MNFFKKRRERVERELSAEKKIAAMYVPCEDEIRAKLAAFYNSEYVKHCQPWIQDVPREEWVERQIELRKIKGVVH